MTIAIIPARGGSKRIPGKNIRPFLGTPILERVINTAQASGCFAHIIVSTDSEAIADIARTAGASLPFMRPSTLADDQSTSLAVMAHAVATLAEHGIQAEHYCLLYPTAVFTTAQDLQQAYTKFKDAQADFCFPVVDFDYPIQRALEFKGDHIVMCDPNQHLTRSQDLAPAVHDAGQFYWGRRAAFLAQRSPFDGSGVGLHLPRYRCVDIDTNDDWARAELMFRAMQDQGYL